MIAFAYYLLKVMVCSGILYGYYHLALKDKVFHQWNRFYLLGSVLIAMLLPLVQVEVNTPVQTESKVITVLQMVSGADEYVREVNAKPMSWMNGELLSFAAYGLVSIATLVLFLLALYRIHQMIHRHETVAIDDFYFLNTSEPGTPFSYFRFLLWNREIPLDTENGQRILEHELVHIREKHSWDKLFIQLTLVAFWINPFFWLIRKELSLVHEFIADRKTVGNGDTRAFARLLLETSFPGYAPMMTNSFFTSSIKRRLAMMTKQQQPGLNYFSRLMMIPLLFILLFVFSVKAKTMFNPEPKAYQLDKPVTVVIDAGHGGTDAGAMNGSTYEKNLNLEIVKAIKRLNTNPNLNIVLSRQNDVLQPVPQKVDFTKQAKGDLFISVHVNAAPTADRSGVEAVVSGNVDNPFAQQNARIASLLLKNVSTVYKTEMTIKKRERTVYVLDKNICPSVIVEMGYLTNQNDLQFISNATNQEKLARQVLKSIEEYFNPSVQVVASSKEAPAKDTTGKPRIELTKYDPQGSSMNGKVTKVSLTASSDTLYFAAPISAQFKKTLPTDLKYTIDGKPSYPGAVERLKPEEIFSISVNKSKTIGDNGSIDIITKAAVPPGTPAPQINPNQPLVISLSGKNTNSNEKPTLVGIKRDPNAPEPLYIVDGEEKTKEGLNEINPDKIAEVKVLKGDDAEKLYGSKGKNGAMIITTKK
ncbi:MAG: N-acetylmuramoyl-L-alanine amidase [Chitinophagaceae bacterium]